MPETKPFEKKVLPANKPVLCHFGRVPKEGKPAVFEGRETPQINLMFKVADNKYPELIGYPLFWRCNPWINNYNGKSTKLWNLLCEMAGKELPDEWLQTDARTLTDPEWGLFFGYYVVKMDPPEYAEDGVTLRWQGIDEILHPDGIEFPVDSRQAGETHQPLGMPVPVKTPVDKPPAQDKPEPGKSDKLPTHPPATPIAEVQELMRTLTGRGGEFRNCAIAFLRYKKAEKVSAMPEADQRHLYSLLQIVEHDGNGAEYSKIIEEHMQRRKAQSLIEDLTATDVELLLGLLDNLASDVPF